MDGFYRRIVINFAALLLASAGVLTLGAFTTPVMAAAGAGHAKVTSKLAAGHSLRAGQRLVAAGRQYALAMEKDGNLAEVMQGHVLWSSGTAGHRGAHATLRRSGILEVVARSGKVLWRTHTGRHKAAAYYLEVKSDGKLVIYAPGGKRRIWEAGSASDTLWAKGTLTSGQYLISANGQYELIMQRDGDLVEYMSGHALWSSGTSGHRGARVTMQSDGNLVVYRGSVALWSSGTGGHAAAAYFLAVQDDSNLVVYTPAGSPLWASYTTSDLLWAGDTLTAGQFLTSPGGQYQLIMQGDGNLVEYMQGHALWSSGTVGHPGARVIMQGDGNLVVYIGHTALWSSGTGGHPAAAYYLAVQVDANLVVYTAGGAPLWASSTVSDTLWANDTLTAGQYLTSPGGQYKLIMQGDGNLVVYDSAGAIWSSGTAGHPGARVIMQGDGNLVVYLGSTPLWSSGTGGHAAAAFYLVMQGDGNLVVYAPGGTALWASQASWAGSSFCASYNVRYMGTTYNGVAACGNAYPNNYQGEISYKGVEFDSVGFQCVELAARYFYVRTGKAPPLVQDASDFAYYLGADDGYNVYPSGLTGVTSTYQSSLAPGQIVSMWSSSDEVGHVAVVTAVNVSNGNGTITVMDENAAASGTDTITVTNGTMNYEGIYPYFQWTTNLP
jgi:surface antigen